MKVYTLFEEFIVDGQIAKESHKVFTCKRTALAKFNNLMECDKQTPRTINWMTNYLENTGDYTNYYESWDDKSFYINNHYRIMLSEDDVVDDVQEEAQEENVILKEYIVSVPFHTFCDVNVLAKDEEEAILKAKNAALQDCYDNELMANLIEFGDVDVSLKES